MRQLIWLNGVASYEDAVMELVGTGVIDQARVGIAGYSRGSQMVNVPITNSSLFRAASSGDGGDLEPAFYPDVSGSYAAVFGGPPVRKSVGQGQSGPVRYDIGGGRSI